MEKAKQKKIKVDEVKKLQADKAKQVKEQQLIKK